MTTAPVQPDQAAMPDVRETGAKTARLGTVLTVHTVTDFFSFLFVPIMSVLEGRLSLTPEQGAIILSMGAVCSGLIQPIVAWAGDKLDTRLLSPIALAMAVCSMSMVGVATEFWHLLVIQIVGTMGIGAFHPAAAAASGQLAGKRRSLGVSLFFCFGMAGGVLGNNLSPYMERAFGLERYIWLMIPGLLAAAILTWAIRKVPHRHHEASSQHAAWSPEESQQRWFAIGVLYFGNIWRFTVNMMMVQLVIRWTEQAALARTGSVVLDEATRQHASQINGPMQGAMQLGMAAGGLAAGAFLRTHHEKISIIVVPVVGALAIIGFPYVTTVCDALGIGSALMPLAFVLAMATGLGYAGVIPVTIALAQRLLPHRTALASGLMMGGAWGFGAVGPPLAQWLTDTWSLRIAFLVTGIMLAVAGAMSLALPSKLLARVSPH